MPKNLNFGPEETFTPFGEEWEKELLKLTKKELVGFIKNISKKNINLESDLINIRKKPNRLLRLEKPNYEILENLSQNNDLVCLFDDGTYCSHEHEHPNAIMTHFVAKALL